VTIALVRPQGLVSANGSKVTLGEAFSITSPTPVSVALGSTLHVTISPPPTGQPVATFDHFTMDVTDVGGGSCIADHQPFNINVGITDGSIAFDTSVIPLKQGAASSCNVSFQVRHETSGTGDPAFGQSGDIEGLQARSFGTALTH